MTVNLFDLWLPIVLGGALAWVVSGLIHMVVKYHNADYKPLSNEDDVLAAVGKGSPRPGLYTFPYCGDMADMKKDSVQQKFGKGPVGMLAIFPNGMPPMGKLLGQQVLFFIVGCVLIAYCAALALAPGAGYMTVFRFVSAVAFVAFGWAIVPFSIWYGHPWSNTARYLLDALIYALVIAGTFAWLWPGVA